MTRTTPTPMPHAEPRPEAHPALPVPPPWLLAAASSLWGVAGGQELMAALALIVVVLLPLLGLRLLLAPATRTRLGLVVAVVFGGWILLRFQDEGPTAVYRVLGALPAVVAALVWLQLQSREERLPWQVLAPALARLGPRDEAHLGEGIELRPLFLLVCLVAAGVDPAIGGSAWLALSSAVVALWLLLPRLGPGRARLTACLAALLLALGLQLLVTVTLRAGFLWLEGQVAALIDDGGRRVDPLRSETRIGSITRLKQRETVELRVEVPTGWSLPLRLTEAVYDHYHFGTWTATRTVFQTIDRGGSDAPFVLGDTPGVAGEPLAILDFLATETVALAVPLDAAGVASRALFGLSGNALGSLRADGRRGHLRYRVLPGQRGFAAPGPADRRLPEFLAAPLADRARALGLTGLPAQAAVARLAAHFRTGFRYSLEPPPYRTGQALLDFLDDHRSGHCEYFATAGALLLRAAGVPTRYAVGFWLGEWDSTLDSFVARSSHAHAWTLVWDGSRWQEADFTPPAALVGESERAPLARRWASLMAWLGLAWHGEVEDADTTAGQVARDGTDWPWLAAVLALTLLLGWLRLRRRRRPVQDPARLVDDRLAALLERLAGSPLGPRPAECVSAWLARIAAPAGLEDSLVRELVELHARSRYAAPQDGPAASPGLDACVARLHARLAARRPGAHGDPFTGPTKQPARARGDVLP